MKTLCLLISLFAAPLFLPAQSIHKKLDDAVKQLEGDSQMKHAIVGFYVVNTKTGAVIYARNSEVGLAAASSQKVITSTASLELLGTNYRYKTELGYDGNIGNDTLTGNLFVTGYGDPTLGSWRYTNATQEAVMNRFTNELKKANIKKITGSVYLDASKFSFQPTPGGWIWDDIGNYYGAGVWGLNWHENQYDLILKPGAKEGDEVQILRTDPVLQDVALFNFLKTGSKGSGDNSYIYLPPFSGSGFVNGTVPAGEKQFEVSGSFPNPVLQLQDELKSALTANNITAENGFINSVALLMAEQPVPKPTKIFYTHLSPTLDSINYWFLRKSINFYGETLVKTLALEKNGYGSTEDGLKIIKSFWKDRGIEPTALNMMDGSGLSPQNRVTAHALTTVMQYAPSRAWYTSFYNALPEYNNLKMKSGTIGGAKSFTGYSTGKDGTPYAFAIIINNYNGAASEIVKKMYKVLDVLK